MECDGKYGAQYLGAMMILRNWIKTHSEGDLIRDIGTFEHVEALRYLMAAGVSWIVQQAIQKHWSELG